MESFRKLGLSEPLIKMMEAAKFKEPSEIQQKTIPLALAKKDIIGGSATGSGKTLAFGVSIIEFSEKGKGIQALILTPTRELAEQVGKVLNHFSSYKKLNIVTVYGGVGITPQMDALEDAEIVVGTPGRILDHIERRTIDLSSVNTLVLDEADRMLDMGFIEDVERIISFCPKKRQTMLFSATISQEIEHISKKHMINPTLVSVESYVDASLLKQIYYDVDKDMKFSLLVHLLKSEKAGLVMVFCNTRINADFVANNLHKQGIEALAIHGGLTQQKRSRIMENFKSQKVYVLVCTDIAARGLDIKNVSHVYNYDSPKNSSEYIHRIGRTARAGKDGIAITILGPRDYDNFRNVLMDGELKISQEPLPEGVNKVFISFNRDRNERGSYGGGRSFGGRGGSRSSGNRRFGGNREHGGGGERSFGGRSGGRSGGSGRRESSGGRGYGRGRRY